MIEAPFRAAGAPARLEGREAIREYSRHALASPLRLEDFEVAELYQTQDAAKGFDDLIRLARQQLPSARQQPGFKGFYLLTDAETGKVITISLWGTREQMETVEARAGSSRDQAAAATGLTPPRLETYEVTMQA